MPNFKNEFFLKIVFFVSLITIFSAYYIEYVLGYLPCNLCLIERIPYMLSIIILIINYYFIKNDKFLILLLILIFFFSLFLSIYHFGIEQGFFEESSLCSLKSGGDVFTKEELLVELQKKTVSCKDVTFRIFGFSLTVFNMFISLVFIVLLVKIFISYEKR